MRKKRGAKTGRAQRKLAGGDIPKHKCKKEVERSVINPGEGPWKPATKTTYYRCARCHVSMGSETKKL